MRRSACLVLPATQRSRGTRVGGGYCWRRQLPIDSRLTQPEVRLRRPSQRQEIRHRQTHGPAGVRGHPSERHDTGLPSATLWPRTGGRRRVVGSVPRWRQAASGSAPLTRSVALGSDVATMLRSRCARSSCTNGGNHARATWNSTQGSWAYTRAWCSRPTWLQVPSASHAAAPIRCLPGAGQVLGSASHVWKSSRIASPSAHSALRVPPRGCRHSRTRA